MRIDLSQSTAESDVERAEHKEGERSAGRRVRTHRAARIARPSHRTQARQLACEQGDELARDPPGYGGQLKQAIEQRAVQARPKCNRIVDDRRARLRHGHRQLSGRAKKRKVTGMIETVVQDRNSKLAEYLQLLRSDGFRIGPGHAGDRRRIHLRRLKIASRISRHSVIASSNWPRICASPASERPLPSPPPETAD